MHEPIGPNKSHLSISLKFKSFTLQMGAHYLLGSGDLAREIIAGFFPPGALSGVFDDQAQDGIAEYNLPCLSSVAAAAQREGAFYLAAGSPQIRKKLHDQLNGNAGASWPTMHHPTAVFYERSSIVWSSVVCFGGLHSDAKYSLGERGPYQPQCDHRTRCADRCFFIPHAECEYLG